MGGVWQRGEKVCKKKNGYLRLRRNRVKITLQVYFKVVVYLSTPYVYALLVEYITLFFLYF